jgi:hypothetical protein
VLTHRRLDAHSTFDEPKSVVPQASEQAARLCGACCRPPRSPASASSWGEQAYLPRIRAAASASTYALGNISFVHHFGRSV